MALIEFEGFDLAPAPSGWVDHLNFTEALGQYDSAAGRSRTAGGRSVYTIANASTRGPGRILPSALTEGGCAAAFLQILGAHTAAMAMFQLRGADATVHVSVVLNTTGQLEIRRGGTTGTLLATSTLSGLTVYNSWLQMGVDWKIDDAAGWCRVYVNGDPTPAVEFDGDTRNGGAAAAIAQVGLHIGGGSDSAYKRLDDWYLYDHTDATATQGQPNNGYLGDCRVEVEIPNGNGATSQWVGSDGNSVDNYLLVDDVTTTDYVGSPTTGNRDLYTLTDLTPASGGGTLEVLGVQLLGLAAKSDAGAAPDILGVLRDADGTVDTFTLAPSAGLTTAFQWFRGEVVALDPDGVAWTATSVNALQAGVEVG